MPALLFFEYALYRVTGKRVYQQPLLGDREMLGKEILQTTENSRKQIRRMDAKIMEGCPEIYSFIPIHFETRDRSPANGGDTDDFRKIFAPKKVFVPRLVAWVEKWHHFTGYRVRCFCLVEFASITELTSIGKVGVVAATSF